MLDSRAGRQEHGGKLQALLKEALANGRGTCRQRLSALRENNDRGAIFGLEVFGPCEIKAMSIALDEVCGKLGLTDDKHEEKAVLAKRVIALARNGERDSAVLRDGVLRELAVSAWRGMSHFDRALPR
jgi:hypothetical protein